jgi:hypothetical protein
MLGLLKYLGTGRKRIKRREKERKKQKIEGKKNRRMTERQKRIKEIRV